MPRKKETADDTLREHFPPLTDPLAEIAVQMEERVYGDGRNPLAQGRPGTYETFETVVERLCGTCRAFKAPRMGSMGLCKLNPIGVNKGASDYCLQWAPRPEPLPEAAPAPQPAGEVGA